MRWERSGQAGDFGDGAAGQLHADDIGVAGGEGGDEVRVEVEAVADGGEVVDEDRQRRLRRYLRVEARHDGRGRLLAEIGAGEHEGEVGARVVGVGDVREDLRGRVGADAGDDGVVGRDGLADEVEEGFALGAGEEEGFGVGAEDDEAGEAGAGQVGEVGVLGGEVEGVGCGVEEGDGGDVAAGWGDGVGVRGGGVVAGGGLGDHGGCEGWRFVVGEYGGKGGVFDERLVCKARGGISRSESKPRV